MPFTRNTISMILFLFTNAIIWMTIPETPKAVQVFILFELLNYKWACLTFPFCKKAFRILKLLNILFSDSHLGLKQLFGRKFVKKGVFFFDFVILFESILYILLFSWVYFLSYEYTLFFPMFLLFMQNWFLSCEPWNSNKVKLQWHQYNNQTLLLTNVTRILKKESKF